MKMKLDSSVFDYCQYNTGDNDFAKRPARKAAAESRHKTKLILNGEI